MKLAMLKRGDQSLLAIADGTVYRELTSVLPTHVRSIQSLIEQWHQYSALLNDIELELLPTIEGEHSFLCPVRSQNVFCIGLNYRDHAEEAGMAIPDEPVVFNKTPNTLAAHRQDIVLPTIASQIDYEAELVIVIGQRAERVSVETASEYIFGFTVGHDVSARDWQLNKPGKQWLLGKSFTGFAPIGPTITTIDEIDKVESLDISLRLNGEVRQNSNTKEMIFGPAEIVSYISQVVPLLPGDVIFTGTPPGVGMALDPPQFLQANDLIEIEIESLGVLENRFVSQ